MKITHIRLMRLSNDEHFQLFQFFQFLITLVKSIKPSVIANGVKQSVHGTNT